MWSLQKRFNTDCDNAVCNCENQLKLVPLYMTVCVRGETQTDGGCSKAVFEELQNSFVD